MSVNSFRSVIWSANILDPLEKTMVFGNLCNRDYEGEISALGDTVKINEIGDITINSYTRNSTTDLTIQELTDAQQELKITRARYFAFKVDDVDDAQTKPKLMSKATSRSGYAMANDIDSWIAQTISSGGFFAGTNSTQLGSTVTALSVTSTLVIDAIGWASRIMDQNNVSPVGRWMVCDPSIRQQMISARIIQDTDNTKYLDRGPGAIGDYYGFTIYVSNNAYSTYGTSSQRHTIFGHSMGVTFAQQLADVEAYRMTKEGFGDVVKGLNLYGLKITRPACILKGVFTP